MLKYIVPARFNSVEITRLVHQLRKYNERDTKEGKKNMKQHRVVIQALPIRILRKNKGITGYLGHQPISLITI